MHIYMVSNSPGEITGWVRPVAKVLKKQRPDASITLIIPPCQYASGKEAEVARGFPQLDYVVSPRDYLRYVFLGKSKIPLPSVQKEGAVVFLGGDPFHAIVMARKLNLPAVAYLQKPRWRRRFEKFMVLSQDIKNENFLSRKVDSEKVVVVGDLMRDAVRFQLEDEKNQPTRHSLSGSPIISIMPGSRFQIAQNMTPFFLRVCEYIRQVFPQAKFFLILSSFIDKKRFFNQLHTAQIYDILDVPGIKFLPEEKGEGQIITSRSVEVSVVKESRYRIMHSSDLALSIPGTSTAELACLGTPMIVVLPLQKPEMIPLDGLAGLLGRVPYLGVLLKKCIINMYSARTQFCALPNIRAGREVVPEMRGKIQPPDVADEVIKLLKDEKKLRVMSKQLTEMMDKGGAAGKVCEVVLKVAEHNKLLHKGAS